MEAEGPFVKELSDRYNEWVDDNSLFLTVNHRKCRDLIEYLQDSHQNDVYRVVERISVMLMFKNFDYIND